MLVKFTSYLDKPKAYFVVRDLIMGIQGIIKGSSWLINPLKRPFFSQKKRGGIGPRVFFSPLDIALVFHNPSNTLWAGVIFSPPKGTQAPTREVFGRPLDIATI